MLKHVVTKSKLIAEKFSEAWTACMMCMVQGDLSVISLKHAYVASKTGILTGIGVVITSYVARLDNKYGNAAVTGLVTALADIAVHPTHFGEVWTEAAITGLVAALLAFGYLKVTR